MPQRPMGHANHLEAAGESLGQAVLHEEWRRPQNDDTQPATAGCVLVPQPFHRLGPAGCLMDFVKEEHGSFWRSSPQSSDLPLLRQPDGAFESRLVGRDVVEWGTSSVAAA